MVSIGAMPKKAGKTAANIPIRVSVKTSRESRAVLTVGLNISFSVDPADTAALQRTFKRFHKLIRKHHTEKETQTIMERFADELEKERVRFMQSHQPPPAETGMFVSN
jgi:hypothetical protein